TGDTTILPLFLEACEHFTPMSVVEQEALVAGAAEYVPLFA
ncbi:MAG: hypothetical protein HW418_2810, partial [Anaerolineales bacterium]|nr:hypothetical protein [Anaerolineales bacterium]